MTIRTFLSAGLCVAIALVTYGTAAAQIPAKLNYQVMLTDDADQPLADQAVVMVFTIYDAESGGTALWTETHNPTTNSIGVVSVILGGVTPIGFDFDMPLWLEVEVDSETLSPRRTLTAAPYAGHAAGADDSEKLGGIDASEYTLLSEVGGNGHSLDADDGDPVDALYVTSTGDVKMGGPGDVRHLLIAGTSNLDAGVCLESTENGGGLILHNEVGGFQGAFVTTAGGGADLLVARNDLGQSGFEVEGNYVGSNQPRVKILGTYRSAVFNMGEEGDDSVVLPVDAIGAAEIEDEPGVASIQADSWVDVEGSVLTVGARYIDAPAQGYVFVSATVLIEFDNRDNKSHFVYLGLSELQNAWSTHAQEFYVSIPGGEYGHYFDTVTITGIFAIDEGMHTFYLNARQFAGDVRVGARQFNVLYFPTAHGAVDLTD